MAQIPRIEKMIIRKRILKESMTLNLSTGSIRTAQRGKIGRRMMMSSVMMSKIVMTVQRGIFKIYG